MRFTDDYLLYLMAQASASVSSEFHSWLEAEGVAVGDWRIMASLLPDLELTVGELAASCMVKQPTMTRMIDRLSERGVVIRRASDGDRRRVAVSLTPQGRIEAKRLAEEAKAHEARILSRYDADPKDLKDLLRLLARKAPML